MKKIIKILTLLLLLSACSKGPVTFPENNKHKMLISNLNTGKALDEVTETMETSGLSNDKVKRFKKAVKFFNKNIDNSLLLNESYKQTDEIIDYDVYAMQESMFEEYPEFPGINCRITTFGLVSDLLTIDDAKSSINDATIIDNQAFKNPPTPTLSEAEVKDFNEFYSIISLDKNASREDDQKKIAHLLSKFFTKFKEKPYSIISVYVYSDIDPEVKEAFVGHTGLLLELDDSRIMLVEKLAFTAPYQAVIFENRDDLYDYLMQMYDTSTPAYPNKPLIFENEKPLK